MLLAGDIGGTKTALALFEPGDVRRPVHQGVYSSRDSDSLDAIVRDFLRSKEVESHAGQISAAAFGVAGPVIDHRAAITNLTWSVSREQLAECLRIEASQVALLNDLEATANAVPSLTADDLQTLSSGQPLQHAVIAVIAPGTGLGQAYLTWDGTSWRPHPSEGGHVDFAPCDPLQLQLLNYLYRKYEHVSFERVVSGMGISEIYEFLRDTGRAEEPPSLKSLLSEVEDRTPVIMAQEQNYPICAQALNVFVDILGAKAGNVALSLMSRGGVFLGGGIPPRILPRLQSGAFLQHFTSKGRFSAMMREIPVHVIVNSQTALLGAALAAAALNTK